MRKLLNPFSDTAEKGYVRGKIIILRAALIFVEVLVAVIILVLYEQQALTMEYPEEDGSEVYWNEPHGPECYQPVLICGLNCS